MALEILAFRVIGKTFGSALRETSTVISVFLIAMSIGYYAGGRAIDLRARLSTLGAVLAVAGGWIALIPALDRVVAPRIYSSSLPIGFHAALSSIAVFFVPTLLLASTSPMVIRLFSTDTQHSGRTAGRVSAASTVGSIAGSVITAFFLIDFFGSVSETLYALAIVTLFLPLLLVAADRGARWSRAFAVASPLRRVALLACAALVVGATLIAWSRSAAEPVAASSAAGAPDYGHVVRYDRDSAYHHILVRDFNRTRNLYFDLNLQSTMLLDDEFDGGCDYTRYYHFAYVLNPAMQRVLFIGVGGGTGPKEFVHDYPGVSADGVDVDPAVLDVARKFFNLKEGPRLHLFATDGRQFVRRAAGQKYDAIVVDAYTTNRYGSTIPPHLTTREFFEESARLLTPGGVVVYNCAAHPNAVVTRAFSKTLYSVYPYQLSFDTGSNTIFVASARDIRTSADALRTRVAGLLSSRRMRDRTFLDRAARLVRYRSEDYDGVPLFTDDYAPVDTLLRKAWGKS